MAQASNYVDPAQYAEHDVKRGLRDASGRGVLAGLTQIGEVAAYVREGDALVPGPGQLVYRGIDINDLVKGFLAEDRPGFEETAYLLLFGELPDEEELREFGERVAEHRVLPKRFVRDAVLPLPSPDVMNAMARSVLTLYVQDKDPDSIDVLNVLRQSMHLIAKFPSLAVYAYQAYLHHFENSSLVIHAPVPELSTAENILHMLRPDSTYTPLEAKLLDLALVLHAEHGGGNNSSFTAHVVSSTGTDTYATIAAALGSLKGPRHGGATLKAVRMFEDLKENVRDWEDDGEVDAYLLRLLNREAFDRAGLVYGMGHAVYSVSDPRALLLKRYAEMLADEKGRADEYRLHVKVEELAPGAIAKTREMHKGVSANVDFYSGFVYSMLEIPPELFIPVFAIARTVGWCAHRLEEIANGGKIIRPAYRSVAPRREYLPLAER
ncbi:MAG: citrate/2-methylcitrate synthase [Coriobacteriia bacterium]|nr:citrate/2-methylcitrate synthase [Coriobacteriia bacterium]